MKYTPAILPLCLLLAVCSGQETNLEQRVTGTWTQTKESTTVTMIYLPDSSFSVTTKTPDHTNFMAGTWQFKDGVIIMSVTNANTGNLRFIGQTLKCRVNSLKDHQLEYQNIYESVGPTNTFNRL